MSEYTYWKNSKESTVCRRTLTVYGDSAKAEYWDDQWKIWNAYPGEALTAAHFKRFGYEIVEGPDA